MDSPTTYVDQSGKYVKPHVAFAVKDQNQHSICSSYVHRLSKGGRTYLVSSQARHLSLNTPALLYS
jgi:hypothetical protein